MLKTTKINKKFSTIFIIFTLKTTFKYVGFEEQEKKERGEDAMNENLEIRATSENEEPMVKENKLPTEEEMRDMTGKAVDEKKFDLECEAQKI